MGRRALEKKLDALDALRAAPSSPDTLERLRTALRDRNNYAVSKAAALAGELALRDLVPDLLAAFDRFLAGGAAADPQCWAKNAISRALAAVGHQDADVFVRGLAHVQPEPVWGGHTDTAAALRGICAMALPGCRLGDIDVLAYLVEALADPDQTVRIEAAFHRAVAPAGERPAAASQGAGRGS